jgi:hypothetical protein
MSDKKHSRRRFFGPSPGITAAALATLHDAARAPAQSEGVRKAELPDLTATTGTKKTFGFSRGRFEAAGTAKRVSPRQPCETPRREKKYPEPSGSKEDKRPAFVLDTVSPIAPENCEAPQINGVPLLVMVSAKAVSAFHCAGLPDFQSHSVARKEI